MALSHIQLANAFARAYKDGTHHPRRKNDEAVGKTWQPCVAFEHSNMTTGVYCRQAGRYNTIPNEDLKYLGIHRCHQVR